MNTVTKEMTIREVLEMGCAAHGSDVNELAEELNSCPAEKA